jgi:hypothetical protein
MAKKRVFLDECCGDLRTVFGAKARVYTAAELGVLKKGRMGTFFLGLIYLLAAGTMARTT